MSECRQRISLRFNTSETERYFVKSQSEYLMRNLFVLSLVTVLVSVAPLPALLLPPGATPGDHRVTRSKQLVIGAALANVFIGLMMAMGSKMRSLQKRVRYEVREVVVVLLMMCLSVTPFLMSSFYGPAILGYSPWEIWDSEAIYSDTRPILALSLSMTATHVTLPIRWVVLFPFEVFSLVVYAAFAFILGGPDGIRAWNTWVLYAGVVLASAIGRRTIENHQRDALVQLINERQLRAETEFKLTQLEQKSPKEEDRLTTRESRPETTPSASLFVSAARDGDFQSVIEVGKHENWLIIPKELDLNHDHVLGQGAFGKVVTCFYAGAQAAVKLMPEVTSRLQVCEDQAVLASMLHEIRIMRRLHHPRIVAFYGACFDMESGTASLVLEWVQGPCLERFILQGGVPDRPLIAADQFKAIFDTCWAVCYLHTRQPSIIHGDLKGTNIIMERDPLRSDSFQAKLLDFGLSRVLTRHVEPMGGSTMWVAPEVICGQPAHCAADTFSFGRLSFFILTGVFPFSRRLKRRQIVQLLESGSLPALPWPIASSKLVEKLRWWVEACSDVQPSGRPSMEDVANFLMGMLKEADSSNQDPEQHSTSHNLPRAASEAAGADQEPVAELVLDFSQEGLPIKECSHEFTLRFGHVAVKSHFAGLVGNINEYEPWMQESVNCFQRQKPPPDLRITLHMPQGPVKAACRVVPQSGSWGSGDDEASETFDTTAVRIQFFKMSPSKATKDSKGTPVSHLSL